MAGVQSAVASEVDIVTVTIDRLENRLGCVDPGFFVCDSPADLFARVKLIGADGLIVDCGYSRVSPNQDVATPQQVVCDQLPDPMNPMFTVPVQIRRPFFVHVEIWDADGPGYPPTLVPALELDSNLGPQRFGELGPFNFPFPSQQQLLVRGSEADALVTVTTQPKQAKFRNRPSLLPSFIDNQVGETTRIMGGLDNAELLRITAVDPSTGLSIPIADVTGDAFDFAWDAKDRGVPLPYGTYDIVIENTDGTIRETLPLQLGPAQPLVFQNMRLDSPSVTNFESVLPALAFTLADPSAVQLEVFDSCTLGNLIRKVPVTLGAGRQRIEWDGLDQQGVLAPLGTYCLGLRGSRLSDNRTYFPVRPEPVIVEAWTPYVVEVRTTPASPALTPTGTVKVRARAFDSSGRLRKVAHLQVAATTFPSAPLIDPFDKLGDCFQTFECEAEVPAQLFATGTLAIRATGEELRGSHFVDSGVRLVDLVAGSAKVVRLSVAAVLNDHGVNEVPKTDAADIAYHLATSPSGDGKWPTRADSALTVQMDALWGFFQSGRGTSRIFEGRRSTNLWAVPTLAEVIHGGSSADPPHDFCKITSANYASSVDLNIVLHELDCRDNAGPWAATSMAYRGDIGWHETHHTPFGLFDEYCCDGGYFQAPVNPNVYGSMTACLMYSSNPATCMPIGNLGLSHFVSDPGPADVMGKNASVENADDLRRMNGYYADCAQGGC
ncbi:MAG: hypothetical protein U1E65_16050 [Myxococcota bacterium]